MSNDWEIISIGDEEEEEDQFTNLSSRFFHCVYCLVPLYSYDHTINVEDKISDDYMAFSHEVDFLVEEVNINLGEQLYKFEVVLANNNEDIFNSEGIGLRCKNCDYYVGRLIRNYEVIKQLSGGRLNFCEVHLINKGAIVLGKGGF